MKTPRLLPRIVIALGCLFGGLLHAAAPPPLQVVGNEFRDPSGNRVILRGASLNDARYNITDDNNRGVNFVIDKITDASAGWHTKVIRIPVHPGTFFTSSSGVFDQAKADHHYDTYLLPTINKAAAKGLYAIVELHYVDNPFTHATRTNQFWAYMAPRLKNFPHVLFELYNEPEGNNVSGHPYNIGLSWSAWKALAQPWINTIRNAGATNVILVGGPHYCQHMREAATDLFADANLAYVAHVYPQFFGRSGSTLAAKLNHELGPLLALRPVIITEWGYVYESQYSQREFYGTQTSFGDPFRAWVDANHVSWTAWCADDTYLPSVFNSSWQVRSGNNYHGEFLRQWLFDKRNSDQPNHAPSVTLTSPAHNSSIAFGQSVTLSATASDSDGSVALVEFYRGGSTPIGDDTSSPWSILWTPSSAGTYSLTARATDNRGDSTTSAAVTLTVNPATPNGEVRIISGTTSSFTDGQSRLWSGDTAFSGGSTVDRGNIAIAGTTDDRIYQTERYGMSGYAINLANGAYIVHLHFAETFTGITAAGQRVFSVSAEGSTPAPFQGIDIFNEAGGRNTALVKSALVNVSDGQLNLGFSASANSALVNGIEIVPAALNTTYQAENASHNGFVPSPPGRVNHTGTSFVDMPSGSGFIQWTISAPAYGSYQLKVRYANGGSTNRNGTIKVNNGPALTLSCPPTGGWDTWQNATLTVTLQGGGNTIRLEASNGPDVDCLIVSP